MLKQCKNFYLLACHVMWRELSLIAAKSENKIFPRFLRMGLHDTPENMRKELQTIIDEADTGEYDAILLGYGLCGNGTAGLGAQSTPIVIPRGHDCVTFFLGSKEKYREQVDNRPGTYWYTPGWIENSRVPGPEQEEYYRTIYREKYDPEQVDMMVDLYRDSLKGYTHTAYIDTGLVPADGYRDYTKECADFLGIQFDEIRGDDNILADFISGNWDEERFLIVPPGHKIEISVGNEIVKSVLPIDRV
jgi:hypothetical protein